MAMSVGIAASMSAGLGRTGIRQRSALAMARTPTGPNPNYGFCNWYLNTGKKTYPAAREDSLSYNGDGANIIFVDYQHDIVAVVRWIDGAKMKEFVRLLIEATGEPAP